MTSHLPDVTTVDESLIQGDVLVPSSPFHALRYQFGMLLGVEDFDAAQAYARGKIRLHNAWLHGEGVIWGFGVSADLEKGEIRVDPGLALDALGHELHLDSSACVHVPTWYANHKDNPGFEATTDDDNGRVTFEARIELRFRACLTRQVPAMAEPCEGGAKGVGYSRAFETVDIKLLAGPPKEVTRSYHLLRMLFGLEPAADAAKPSEDEQRVATRIGEIAATPTSDQAARFLDVFRELAALDGIALRPAQSADKSRVLLYPSEEDAPVLVAKARIALEPSGKAGLRLVSCEMDPTVRRSHVETATIQELTLLALAKKIATKPSVDDWPRMDRAGVIVEAKRVVLPLTGPLDPQTVQPDVFAIVALQEKGWTPVPIVHASQSLSGDANVVTLKTNGFEAGLRHRLVARGIGPRPLLGHDGRPFGGATDDPRRPTEFDGIDFVHMWKKAPQ